MIGLTIDRIGVTFGAPSNPVEVLRDLTLKVVPGEVIAIRGPNGTGKTTLLNVIAGLLTPTTGKVRIDPPPTGRSLLGFVQQDYTSSLLPWCTVLDNVALPLRLRGVPRGVRRSQAADMLAQLGFSSLPVNAYPHQLSGGQRQRVAIARALVDGPALLFLDEPFANLDGPTIRELKRALLVAHSTRRMTIVFVSHELDGCIYLSDRVVLLSGRPATIRTEISVPLPRPRTPEQLVSKDFIDVRALILREEEEYDG